MGYSSNQIIKPSINFGRLQTLQNYMTSSCSATKPISRYFKTGGSLARLGIDWINTEEFANFDLNPPVELYGQQLPVDAGSSTNLKLYRSSAASTQPAEIGRLQLTYYIMYKGAKGQGSLTI